MIEVSQSNTVRTLRILYPIWVLVGIFSMMYVPSILLVSGNETQTINNISNNQFMFRLGILGNIVTQLLNIIIPLFLYLFFRNLNQTSAKLMLALALVSVPITLMNEINQLRVLDLLSRPSDAFELLQIYNHGINISSLFWGLWLFPLGWLVNKSKLFPKLIGLSLYLGGIGYFLGGFLRILIPEFKSLNPLLEIMLFGELIFIIWFVVKGIAPPPATPELK